VRAIDATDSRGMAGGGVAVEVDGAGVFEDSAEFDEAWCHHGEVGEHVGAAEEGSEGAHGFGYAATLSTTCL